MFKVIPWFQPMDDASRFDLKGMLKDLEPSFSEDYLARFEVYSGLVVHIGYSLETAPNVYVSIPVTAINQFKHLGVWKKSDTLKRRKNNKNFKEPKKKK